MFLRRNFTWGPKTSDTSQTYSALISSILDLYNHVETLEAEEITN